MSKLGRSQIVAAADASRRATARLASELARQHPDLAKVQACLQSGALVEDVRIPRPGRNNQPPPSPQAALDLVFSKDNHVLLSLLRPALRGRPGQKPASIMLRAAQYGADTCTHHLLKEEGLPSSQEEHAPIVLACARMGCVSALSFALGAGARADAVHQDEFSGTSGLMHEAANDQVVRLLLSHGCPLDFRNGRGTPALGDAIRLLGYENRVADARSKIDELLGAGCAISFDNPSWHALDTLNWENQPPRDLVCRLARMDPGKASCIHPRSSEFALGLLASHVAGQASDISARTSWRNFGYREFSNDAAGVLSLFAQGFPGPSIKQVDPSRLSEWLALGIECPQDQVDRLIMRVENADEDDFHDLPDLDLLKDHRRLTESHARAQARHIEQSTAHPVSVPRPGPRL